MKTATNNFSGFKPENLQQYFDTEFAKVEYTPEDELKYIEQDHFGDMLIEFTETESNERYKLWRKINENGGGILIEYCGAANNYRWETVYES